MGTAGEDVSILSGLGGISGVDWLADSDADDSDD